MKKNLISVSTIEDKCYEVTLRCGQVIREAMAKEYASIKKNDVWQIAPRPEGKSVVTSRWLYKIKYVVDGSIEKFKERFVARGFS